MATLIAPGALVTGAPRQPLPFGLFSAFAIRPEGDGRWQAGVRWEVAPCTAPDGIGAPWCPPDEETIIGLPKDLTPNVPPVGEASPMTIYGHYACSAMSNTFAEAQRLANEHLTSREESRVEQALWTGDLGNVPNFSGANGYPAPTDVGVYDSVVDALASIEQWMADEFGTLGVIHMSRRTATMLAKHLESRGGRLYTKALGTPVVAGAGYGNDAIIGTPAVFGYRSEMFDSSARPGDLMDRGNNDMVAVAERTYVIGFDPCGVGKVTVAAVP